MHVVLSRGGVGARGGGGGGGAGECWEAGHPEEAVIQQLC